MNQQQFQAQATSAQTGLPSFSTPLLPESKEQAQLLETETPQETESFAQEVSAADSYLLPLLQAEAVQRKRDNRNMFLTCSGFLIGISWLVHGSYAGGGQVTQNLVLSLASIYLLLFAVIAQLARQAYRRKRALATELAKPQTLESIGALIEATRIENTQVRSLSKTALTSMLPQLKANDSEMLTSAHRDRLIRLLTISPNDKGYRDLTELFSRSAYRREIDVRVAILKAYEQIGGPKELPQVERLAKGQIHWQSASKVPLEIQEAAQQCLPALQARTSEHQASQQLLRASSGDAVPSDILLRPADERPDTSPEQLLRGSERRITIHTS